MLSFPRDKGVLTLLQPCGSVLVLCAGPSCSLMVWRRRHKGGFREPLLIWWAGWGLPVGPHPGRLSTSPRACSSSTQKEAWWLQLSQNSPASSSSSSAFSCPRRLSSSLNSLLSWPVLPAPLQPLLPRVPHTHTSIPESPVIRRLLPLGSRSLSSTLPSDRLRSFSRGFLQESSPLSLSFSWLASPSLLSPSESSITPEFCAVCTDLVSGFGLKSKVGGCGSSMVGLQHRLSETGGTGEGWMAVQCPCCCSGASGLEATEDGPVCKAL